MVVLYSIYTVILVILSAIFAASETSFFSLPSSRVRLWKNSPNTAQQTVSYLLSNSKRLLVLIFILNMIANILLQNTVSDLFDMMGGIWLLKVLVPLFLIVVFGEFFPKYFGLLYGEKIAIIAAPGFIFLERIFLPIQKIITIIAETISKTLFFFLKKEPPLVKNELESIVAHCEKLGVLSHQEAIFIQATVDFDRKEARDIMTPRSELVFLTSSSVSTDAIQRMHEKTRKKTLLLVDETIDCPIGAILGVEALCLATQKKEDALQYAKKQFFFVPETMPTHKLVNEFARKGAHLACVVDEHGTLRGCIYREDLREQLLGFSIKKSPLQKREEHPQEKYILVPGTTPLNTINNLFLTQLHSDHHCATISGYLIEKLDGIPPIGTCYTNDDIDFRIIEATEKAITHVFIQKKLFTTKKRAKKNER